MAPTTKKLLMLTYGYPPDYGGFAERSVKFVKYLPEYGWAHLVVTKAAGGENAGVDAEENIVRIPNLLITVRERIRTRPAPAGGGNTGGGVGGAMPLKRRLKRAVFAWVDKWLAIPDWQIGWAVSAFLPSWRAVLAEGADAIYSTSPPASSHLLGLALKKATGRPWAMDYRDPWTFEPVNKHLRHPGFRLSLERRLERWCFESADAVIANTPRAGEHFGALYPDLREKIHVITNGFDGEELARAGASLDRPSPWRAIDDSTFVISHAGTFFRYRRGDQTPHALLQALKDLLDEGVISPDTCRMILAGKLPPETVRRIQDLGLTELIEAVGVIPHFDATRLMLVSDLLLLFDPEGDGETYVRSKLYEYIGSGGQILGAVPGGASRDLLLRSGRGLLASPEDPEEIKQALKTALERGNVPITAPSFDPTDYDRRRLTKTLASLLDDLVHGPHRGAGAPPAERSDR